MYNMLGKLLHQTSTGYLIHKYEREDNHPSRTPNIVHRSVLWKPKSDKKAIF